MSWPALLERRSFLVALVAAWALAYLPHLGGRPLRLEEGRRATPAREMLASGDYLRPTLYGQTYLNKPPLYFWMVAGIGAIRGEVDPFATRLPSVIAVLGCALVAYAFARGSLDRRTRALAAMFVLSSQVILEKGILGEIDATLCLMVALALKVWWDGNRPDGHTWASWVGTGLLFGIMGLLKGPAGPVICYLTIVPYLLWAGRWRRLFSFGHLACLALAIVPAAVWATALVDRGVISANNLIGIWSNELGTNHAAATIRDPKTQTAPLLRHYAEFPLRIVVMFLPGILWLPFALRRRWAEAHGMPEDIRRFLVCGAIGPCLALYLYPESRPRHLMAAFFAAAVLAGVIVAAIVRFPGARAPRAFRVGRILAFAPALFAMAGLILTLIVNTPAWPVALVALVVGIGWTSAAVRLNRATAHEYGAIVLAVGASTVPIAAYAALNTIVVPWRAPFSTTQPAVALSRQLPPHAVVYTTRTFPATGEGYYNLQFHLARNVQAAADLDTLKAAAPCVAVVTPAERDLLEAAGCIVDEVGRMGGGKGAPPEALVIRVK